MGEKSGNYRLQFTTQHTTESDNKLKRGLTHSLQPKHALFN